MQPVLGALSQNDAFVASFDELAFGVSVSFTLGGISGVHFDQVGIPEAPACALPDKEQLMTESIDRPLVYTVTQTAALLGISRTHAYELVSRGDLAHVRLGRRIVVPRHALERLLDVVAERPAAS